MKTKRNKTKKNAKGKGKGKGKKPAPKFVDYSAKYETIFIKLMTLALEEKLGKERTTKDVSHNVKLGKAGVAKLQKKLSKDMLTVLAQLEKAAEQDAKQSEAKRIIIESEEARSVHTIDRCIEEIKTAIEIGESVFPTLGENRFYLQSLLQVDTHKAKYGEFGKLAKDNGIDGKMLENATAHQKLFGYTIPAKTWNRKARKTHGLQYDEDSGNSDIYYTAFRLPAAQAYTRAVSYMTSHLKGGASSTTKKMSEREACITLNGALIVKGHALPPNKWSGAIRAFQPNAFKAPAKASNDARILGSLKSAVSYLKGLKVASPANILDIKKLANTILLAIGKLGKKLGVKEAMPSNVTDLKSA